MVIITVHLHWKVIITVHLHTKAELKLYICSNPASSVSEIFDNENLWQWSQLDLRPNSFRWSTIPQNQFKITITNNKSGSRNFEISVHMSGRRFLPKSGHEVSVIPKINASIIHQYFTYESKINITFFLSLWKHLLLMTLFRFMVELLDNTVNFN